MREVVDPARIRLFMQALGREASGQGRVYFAGGATAVLLGWRASTLDIADLYRYPAVDPASFRRSAENVLRHP